MNEFFEQYLPDRNLTFSLDNRLTVFPKATQVIDDAFVTSWVDIMHASPSSSCSLHSKFDMVLIRKISQTNPAPNQLSYGMSGK
jgi:hypothetical protein